MFFSRHTFCAKTPFLFVKRFKNLFFYQKVVQFSNKKILQNTCQNQQKFVKISTNNVKIGQHRVKISKIGQHRVKNQQKLVLITYSVKIDKNRVKISKN